jgi:L-fucose isomerase-like protein
VSTLAGAVSMYAPQLASGRPGALVDWNNNYGDDPDRLLAEAFETYQGWDVHVHGRA